MSFGDNLRTLIEERDITQKELAEILKTSRSNICNYESDRNKPSADLIIIICQTLNISADWLLGLKE